MLNTGNDFPSSSLCCCTASHCWPAWWGSTQLLPDCWPRALKAQIQSGKALSCLKVADSTRPWDGRWVSGNKDLLRRPLPSLTAQPEKEESRSRRWTEASVPELFSPVLTSESVGQKLPAILTPPVTRKSTINIEYLRKHFSEQSFSCNRRIYQGRRFSWSLWNAWAWSRWPFPDDQRGQSAANHTTSASGRTSHQWFPSVETLPWLLLLFCIRLSQAKKQSLSRKRDLGRATVNLRSIFFHVEKCCYKIFPI